MGRKRQRTGNELRELQYFHGTLALFSGLFGAYDLLGLDGIVVDSILSGLLLVSSIAGFFLAAIHFCIGYLLAQKSMFAWASALLIHLGTILILFALHLFLMPIIFNEDVPLFTGLCICCWIMHFFVSTEIVASLLASEQEFSRHQAFLKQKSSKYRRPHNRRQLR